MILGNWSTHHQNTRSEDPVSSFTQNHVSQWGLPSLPVMKLYLATLIFTFICFSPPTTRSLVQCRTTELTGNVTNSRFTFHSIFLLRKWIYCQRWLSYLHSLPVCPLSHSLNHCCISGSQGFTSERHHLLFNCSFCFHKDPIYLLYSTMLQD